MYLRDLLLDPDFPKRTSRSHNAKRELDAFFRLARVFAESPHVVLQELVDVAVEFCGADSAGISLEETTESGEMRFRWVAVAGTFSHFVNGTTPRFFSPCGTTLNSGRAQLYRVTKPYYDFLGIEAKEITDGMLIPWISGEMRGTIWAVSHQPADVFDVDDYELLKSLADFASIAVHYQLQQDGLREKAEEAAAAAMANELAHQINNPLQALCNAIYLASEQGDRNFLVEASKQLDAVTALVRKLLEVSRTKSHAVAR